MAPDLTGRFPVKSRKGNQYVLVTAFHNYIFAVPMPSKTSSAYVTAFHSTFNHLKSTNLSITNITTDNEISQPLLDLFNNLNIKAQFQPPGNHRSNYAERAIRTFKNHFISTLASVHPTFPPDLWDLLIPISILTINHLRPSKLNPSVSAYAGIHGADIDPGHAPLPVCASVHRENGSTPHIGHPIPLP